MNHLFKIIDNYISAYQLLSPQQTIVVGLSGGPDSVFLLQMLLRFRQQMRLTLIAAHLDHEWRESSKKDAQYCAQLCAQVQVPLVSMRACELQVTIKQTGSAEDIGRQLRRAFFAHVKRDYNAHAIALAHHADDQLETFFIRLVRGATVSGLACMRAREGAYIRPLLCVRKEDIVHYLHDQQIAYVIDPTNISQNYLRNRIRAQLAPVFDALDTRALANTQRAIVDLQQTENFLVQVTQQAYDRVCSVAPGVIELKKFFELDPFIQRRVLVHWLCVHHVPCTLSSALIEEIVRFLHNTKSSCHQINTGTLIKTRGHVQLM